MADKIDQLKFGSTTYDIDLPPDATPTITSLTVQAGSGTNKGVCSISVDTSGVDAEASITFSNFGIVGYTSLDSTGITLSAPLVGTYRLNYPILTANAVIATQSWVEGKNYTTNQGTVTSVGAGTGLSISGTASVNPTVNIASGYKLPTTTEWSNKSNKIYRHTITAEGTLDGYYYMFSYISSSSTQVTTPSLLFNLIANNQTITNSVKYKYGVGGMMYDENNDMQYPLLGIGVYKPTKLSSKIVFSILPDDWTQWTIEYAVEDNNLRITDDLEPISNTML